MDFRAFQVPKSGIDGKSRRQCRYGIYRSAAKQSLLRLWKGRGLFPKMCKRFHSSHFAPRLTPPRASPPFSARRSGSWKSGSDRKVVLARRATPAPPLCPDRGPLRQSERFSLLSKPELWSCRRRLIRNTCRHCTVNVSSTLPTLRRRCPRLLACKWLAMFPANVLGNSRIRQDKRLKTRNRAVGTLSGAGPRLPG